VCIDSKQNAIHHSFHPRDVLTQASNPFQHSTTAESVAQDRYVYGLHYYVPTVLSEELVPVYINVTAETQFWKEHF
jgi:hypothetical protein